MKKISDYKLYLIVFFALMHSLLVVIGFYSGFDGFIYDFIISFKSDILTNIFKVITFFASVKFVIIFCLISLVTLIKKNKLGLNFSLIVLISTIINIVLKNIIRRDRPSKLNWLVNESSYSFPSGHSMCAIVVYGLVIYYINKLNISNRLKKVIDIMFCLLIFGVGISRIYLGVHFASDVIGGYLCGLTVLLLSINYLEKKE